MVSKLIARIKKYANGLILLGLFAVVAAFAKFGPQSIVYSGPIGQVEASGPSEIGIAIGLIIIAVGIAGKLIGTKNIDVHLTGKKLRFTTRK